MRDGIDTQERMYQELIGRNPEVSLLVDDLDLMNPQTGLPYGQGGRNPEKRRDLISIAQRVLNRGQIYSSEQVISLIEEKLTISRQRAVNGFEMMMSSGVLISSSGQGIRLSM